MESENLNQEGIQVEQKSSLHQVTPLSKYLAMMLFVILPFLGGWIGYTYAPEKVVEVERVVTREVPVTGEDIEQSVLPEGVTLYRDIKTTFISLSEEDKYIEEEDYTYPDIQALFNGDIKEDSLLISPNRKFIQFHGYPCSRVLGGHCFGQAVVYDVDARTSRQIEVTGDDTAPYNIAEGNDLISPLYRYGKFTGWDGGGRLLFEVDYEGKIYKYQSTVSYKPWVLEYLGVVE